MVSHDKPMQNVCSKPVKPGHNSVLLSHILRVLLTKYGKMTQ